VTTIARKNISPIQASFRLLRVILNYFVFLFGVFNSEFSARIRVNPAINVHSFHDYEGGQVGVN
jgi:hypothetical protein